jgi:NAD+ kinase
MMREFSRIGLMGRIGSPEIAETLMRIKHHLIKGGYVVVIEEALRRVVGDESVEYSSREDLGGCVELVVVVGGDGSVLGAARSVASTGVPLVGVNRGRLGFLTDLPPDDIEPALDEVLAGQYEAEERFLIEAGVSRNGKEVSRRPALNDVIIHPGHTAQMIELEVSVEGRLVYNLRADGLIVSTPTGSTAYALSGGGPILHPELDALVLVPMFPHSLSSRPIVVPGDNQVEIRVSELNEVYIQISCDGQNHLPTLPGDVIRIGKRREKLKMLHPLKHNFYEICQKKLGWSVRPGPPLHR